MKKSIICNYSNRRYLGLENGKIDGVKKRIICPKCKRRIKPGIIAVAENILDMGPRMMFEVVPKHKKKKWWKI